jgi:glycosyltransferase involved in cell wall biosynthesis
MDWVMTATAILSDQPVVSVIVPARNEEACLGACLQSLVSQNKPPGRIPAEIIVVDDHSTDRTREIANSFSADHVQLIDAPALPAGWTGKNNAVTAGSKIARGQWLLFTDADTIHLSGSLASAIDEATRHGAALLSYSPKQIVKSFGEQAVMPVIFAELAATYSPSKVNDPNSLAAAANGQYILITREAYNAVGGHAAIASHLLEDVALARAVKRSGRKIFFRYGDDAVRTRMYRSFAHLREGWTKNLALLFPSPVRLAALRSIELVLIVSSFASAMANIARSHWTPAILSATLAVILYALFLRRVRRAHFYWDANILALFGLPLFSYLLLRSALSYRRGKVTWKGRNYSGKGTGAEQLPPEPDGKLSPALQQNNSSISNSIAKPSATKKGVALRTGN